MFIFFYYNIYIYIILVYVELTFDTCVLGFFKVLYLSNIPAFVYLSGAAALSD